MGGYTLNYKKCLDLLRVLYSNNFIISENKVYYKTSETYTCVAEVELQVGRILLKEEICIEDDKKLREEGFAKLNELIKTCC